MSSALSKRATLPKLSSRWTTADGATEQGDRAAGAAAAKDGPEAPAVLERFWMRAAADGARDLHGLYGECETALNDYDAKRERLRQELETEVVARAQSNQRQHDERLTTLKREVGAESARYKVAAARVEDSHKALRAVRAEVNNRPLRCHLQYVYIPMMIAFAFAEIPVNRPAFELTFREEPIFSLLIAAAVGSALIFVVHFIGSRLRQWPDRLSVGRWIARAAGLLLLTAVSITGVVLMAKLRQGYMRLAAAENDGFAQRLEEALRGGTTGTISLLADLPFSSADYAFLAVNVLLLTFGLLASFIRHDPHPDYERAVRDARRADKAMSKADDRYAATVNRESRDYEDRKRALDAQIANLSAAIAAIRDQVEAIQRHCDSSRMIVAQTIRNRCLSFLDGYGAQARPANAAPPMPDLDTIARQLPTADFDTRAA